MANYRAVANGNWSSGATWGGGSVPPDAAGHNIYSNGFAVTIDQNVDVALITNASVTASFVGGGTSAAAGGGFTVSSAGFTVASTTLTGPNTGNNTLITFSAASGSLVLNGNISAGGSNSTANTVVNVTSGGTLIVNGNVTGGGNYAQSALLASSTSQITVNGNITGSPFSVNNVSAIPYGVFLSGQASLTVNNGTISGSNANTNNAAVINTGTGALTFNNCIINAGTAVPAITNSQTAATLTTINCVHTATQNYACLSSSATLNRLSGTFVFGANGQIPVSASRYFLNVPPSNAYIQMAWDGTNALSYVRFYTADNNLNQANPTDVRNGVSYASGALTGTLTVPLSGSVALSANFGPSMPFTATRSSTTATATLSYSYPYVSGDTIVVTGASNTEWNGTYTIASVISGTSITFNVPVTYSVTAGTGAKMQTIGSAFITQSDLTNAINNAVTSSINPNVTSTINTAVTSSINPNVTSTINTAVTSSINPNVTSTINSAVTSSINPNVTSTINSTVPTAVNTAMDAQWNKQTSALTVSGSIGQRLANTSTAAITGQQIVNALG